MQDDVKAVEMRTLADDLRPWGEKTLGSIRIDVREVAKIVSALDTLAALQERCERLEQAARAALPWVTGEEEATALEAALTDSGAGGRVRA